MLRIQQFMEQAVAELITFCSLGNALNRQETCMTEYVCVLFESRITSMFISVSGVGKNTQLPIAQTEIKSVPSPVASVPGAAC
jgi:hypothetical protein